MLPQLARLLRDEVALTGAARAVLIVTIRQTVLPAIVSIKPTRRVTSTDHYRSQDS
jgi:hypothetical protein